MTDLERRLSDLADHIEWPDRDLSPIVRSRLAGKRSTSPLRLRWVAALAGVVVVTGLLVTPPGRTAVAEILGVVGIEIRWSDDVSAVDSHADLQLGDSVSLTAAVDSAEFALLVPGGLPGTPDAVYRDGDRVSTVWEAWADLPKVGDTGIGLLHMQFPARLDGALLSKRLGPSSAIETVVVRGRTAYWIDGGPHTVTYVDEFGVEREETTRLAGNVLLWEEDGVTHRLETALQRETAIAIAENLQPVEP